MALRKLSFLILFYCITSNAAALQLMGKVIDINGKPVPFCSIIISGTKYATISNSAGDFLLELPAGKYLVSCQHVGFKSISKDIELTELKQVLNFTLMQSEITLDEIIVRQGDEDPAYEIIRQAIKNRKYHKDIIEKLQCESYIKGLIKLKDFPKTFFGQNVDFEDGDTSKQKTIFLSETLADLYYTSPDDLRINVKSTKVSGQSNGLGFSNPQIISFYDNNINISKALNPRGFISPISDGALKFYNYKYKGVFFENGKQISKIEVSPKRKWEPLFTGFIQIVEDEWTIHSLNLSINKESQLEFADKITIEQLYTRYEKDIWLLATQTIYPEVKFFGFDASGYFISLFSNYKINEKEKTRDFGRTILKFDANSNKRSLAYWDSIRPLPLLPTELSDYRKKDSLEKRKEDPNYLDSLDRKQNKVNPLGLILNGQTFINRSKRKSFEYDPLLKSVSFNTVEGLVAQASGTFKKKLLTGNSISLTPVLRYGNTNKHVNFFVSGYYDFKSRNESQLEFSLGKKVFQFNNANPIPQIMNTFSTLLGGRNYLKIYEATFFKVAFKKEILPGLIVTPTLEYQQRMPLVNNDTLNFWGDKNQRIYLTPNYPVEAISSPMEKHNALSAGILIRFRPNSKLIELPDRTIDFNSKSPLFSFEYKKGINKFLGSNVKYDRWKFSMLDELNFKIGGELRYRITAGGFFDKTRLELPDYHHIAGNQTRNAAPYLQSFQVAPFYQFSNDADRFYAMFLEYKLNGLFTNKIPIIRKLNLRLLTGTNTIFINKDQYYIEGFVGLDNILKIIRVDYIRGFEKNKPINQGIRIGIRGFSSLFTDY